MARSLIARFRKGLTAFLVPVTIAGCSTPQRLPAVPESLTVQADPGFGPIRFLAVRDPQSFATEAVSALHKEQKWRAAHGEQGALPPAYYLAISGGGDNGAFGAGLLTGWSESGTRPEFKVVTGISTGALIAPFAFLGSRYDPALTQVYTTISQRDIFKMRGLVRGFFSDAMADSTPLTQLVTHYVDRPMLEAIAAEYARGRLLLVATTDLDALEPVIWNMTAIAASSDPRAPDLFRKILVASASIPGAFPPVMIDVTVNGERHQEMHVDGGTIAQVFLYPPSAKDAISEPIAARKRVLYIIRNARLEPDWADVRRRTLPVAARAVASLTQTQGVGDLYRIYATTQRDGIDYNLAYIPSTFHAAHSAEFDTAYMRKLFATGKAMAAPGYPWQKVPPGF
jgi:predicted acylesterase/phospholipase RssA